jgi:hypothetical protein
MFDRVNGEVKRLISGKVFTEPIIEGENFMGTAYYSNAKWSKIGDSKDRHCNSDDPQKNLEFASSICDALKNNWGHHQPPCETRGTCLKTWVTDESGKTVMGDYV